MTMIHEPMATAAALTGDYFNLIAEDAALNHGETLTCSDANRLRDLAKVLGRNRVNDTTAAKQLVQHRDNYGATVPATDPPTVALEQAVIDARRIRGEAEVRNTLDPEFHKRVTQERVRWSLINGDEAATRSREHDELRAEAQAAAGKARQAFAAAEQALAEAQAVPKTRALILAHPDIAAAVGVSIDVPHRTRKGARPA